MKLFKAVYTLDYKYLLADDIKDAESQIPEYSDGLGFLITILEIGD